MLQEVGLSLGESTAASGGSSSAEGGPQKPDSLEEQQDLGRQAQKAGFTVGAVVAEKKAEEQDLWRIEAIDAEKVKLGLLSDGRVTVMQNLATTHLLQDWRLHKGKATSLLSGYSAENPCSPLTSSSWLTEAVRGAVALAFKAQLLQHNPAGDLELLQNPFAVKVTRRFAKGELVLVAASQRVEKAKTTGLSSAMAVGVGSFPVPEPCHFQVTPHFVAPLDSKGNPAKNPWVAPFWLVETVKKDAECNMELKFFQTPVADLIIHVPALVNKAALKEGDKLYWCRDASQRVPQDTPPKASAKAGGQAAAKAPAAKRAKAA